MASWNHGVKYKQVTSKKLFLEIKVKRPFLSKFFRNPSFGVPAKEINVSSFVL